MPRRDGTGPIGLGSMTGKGLGFCSDYATPVKGMHRGFGLGYGRGFRRMNCSFNGFRGKSKTSYYAFSGAEEKKVLAQEIEFLENQLKNTKKRLNDMSDKEE